LKLLLDENLSRRLVPLLQAEYPGSTQVALIGLEQESDKAIWDYAKHHDYVLVSKDDDFQELQALYGYPPKLIHLLLGNCTNQQVLKVLVSMRRDIELTLSASDIGIVQLGA
jgi:predicted nuclease of predicted toxin-antitoxin system